MPTNASVAEPQRLIQVVTDQVAAKFPHLDRSVIAVQVEACYRRLVRDSRVTDHLAVLVQHDTVEALRHTGHAERQAQAAPE